MQNFTTYHKNCEQVDSILEIRLCSDTWEKIKRVAMVREKSYSWVVRYALFRLIKRKNAQQYTISLMNRLHSMNNSGESNVEHINKKVRDRRNNNVPKHRHRLCLYGEDELFIRLTASSLRCTMTHLIRFALEKYLDSLMETSLSKVGFGRFHLAVWQWLGIKIHYGVELPTISIDKVYFTFQRYQKCDYW